MELQKVSLTGVSCTNEFPRSDTDTIYKRKHSQQTIHEYFILVFDTRAGALWADESPSPIP